MISIVLTTHDNERSIAEVLEALAWCEDIVVIDRESTDHTLDIAKTFANVSIGEKPKHDWILNLHGHEVVSPELSAELQALEPNVDVLYAIPVHTYFNGKQIRHGGWHSRGEWRLTHTRHPHPPKKQRLNYPIRRYPFDSIEEMLDRMKKAANRFKGTPSWWKLLISPSLICMKCYLFQLGFLDGYEGYLLAKYKSHKVFYAQVRSREVS